mmetsp:Transcript_45645/g.74427  ORF Transcript_45645/g.74427 Transcript_45645/m.74427 type:complete len:82 (+) Transcript_45645:761-1006(+)
MVLTDVTMINKFIQDEAIPLDMSIIADDVDESDCNAISRSKSLVLKGKVMFEMKWQCPQVTGATDSTKYSPVRRLRGKASP